MTLADRISAAFQILSGRLDTSAAAISASQAQIATQASTITADGVQISGLWNQVATLTAQIAAVGDVTALTATVVQMEQLAGITPPTS